MIRRADYETGARQPVPKKRPDDNEQFSQEAANNTPPPFGVGNSMPSEGNGHEGRPNGTRSQGRQGRSDQRPS